MSIQGIFTELKQRILKYDFLHGLYLVPLSFLGLYVTVFHIEYILHALGAIIFLFALFEGLRYLVYNPVKKEAFKVIRRNVYLENLFGVTASTPIPTPTDTTATGSSTHHFSDELRTILQMELSNLTNLIRSTLMSVKDDMASAITTLKADLAATETPVTDDHIIAIANQVITPQLTALNTAISGILAQEATDESKLSDVTAAINEFTAAFPAAVAVTTGSSDGTQTAASSTDGSATAETATTSADITADSSTTAGQ